jgi:hypothetical protein
MLKRWTTLFRTVTRSRYDLVYTGILEADELGIEEDLRRTVTFLADLER